MVIILKTFTLKCVSVCLFFFSENWYNRFVHNVHVGRNLIMTLINRVNSSFLYALIKFIIFIYIFYIYERVCYYVLYSKNEAVYYLKTLTKIAFYSLFICSTQWLSLHFCIILFLILINCQSYLWFTTKTQRSTLPFIILQK